MLSRINPTSTPSWQQLLEHYKVIHPQTMRDFFAADQERFSKFSQAFNDIVFDYSKNRITEETLQLLLQLAADCKVKEGVEAMFNGDIINQTEHRSVLHTALRNFFRQIRLFRRSGCDARCQESASENEDFFGCRPFGGPSGLHG